MVSNAMNCNTQKYTCTILQINAGHQSNNLQTNLFASVHLKDDGAVLLWFTPTKVKAKCMEKNPDITNPSTLYNKTLAIMNSFQKPKFKIYPNKTNK